jgi:hypothetical protein
MMTNKLHKINRNWQGQRLLSAALLLGGFSCPVNIPNQKHCDENNSHYGKPVKLLQFLPKAFRPAQQPEQKIACDARAEYEKRKPNVSCPIGISPDALLIVLPPSRMPLLPHIRCITEKLTATVW